MRLYDAEERIERTAHNEIAESVLRHDDDVFRHLRVGRDREVASHRSELGSGREPGTNEEISFPAKLFLRALHPSVCAHDDGFQFKRAFDAELRFGRSDHVAVKPGAGEEEFVEFLFHKLAARLRWQEALSRDKFRKV